ncbi:MAG TPA: hypothetical protein VKR42_01140 [Ktedonobacteraceae bacterium]|nr:hypothetical protein [Ktedonobacteraceae bacterium]
MSNTNHVSPGDKDNAMEFRKRRENTNSIADMPPVPAVGARGPQVCATVQLYLAVLDDLPREQVDVLMQHVRTCNNCTAHYHLLRLSTRAISGMSESVPSARVDQAIMLLIAARSATSVTVAEKQLAQSRGLPQPVHVQKRWQPSFWVISQIAASVILLLGLMTIARYVIGTPVPKTSFALPEDLTWDAYVIYHSETRIANDGEHYIVNIYDDLASGDIHAETMMNPTLDVVAIEDNSMILGLDMMHHIAQWSAQAWAVDQSEESLFNLSLLRSDLASNQDVYLGTDVFHGLDVYRVRCKNGLVLLLDTHYMPVNVLRGAVGPGTGEPIYTTVTLLHPTQVSSSMWNMSVPSGFQMGTLPARP